MSRPIPFIILAAERTGSNLLSGMLDSHPRIVTGGEFFNPVLMEQVRVPWHLAADAERKDLANLRTTDPIAFLGTVQNQAAKANYGAVGFKLMYNHSDRLPAVREHLSSDKQLRVIHLTRRNLLERLLSKRRAELTGKWQQRSDENGGSSQQPAVTIDLGDLVRDLMRIEAWQQQYRTVFADHPLLEMEYERLSVDPHAEARRAIEFLAQDPTAELAVRDTKTSTDELRTAITNHDDLRATLARWLSFFDAS